MEHQSKMEQINAEGQWRMQIEQLRMQGLNIQEQEKSRARRSWRPTTKVP